MIYKVSYMVPGGNYPGGIQDQYERPEKGDIIELGDAKFEVIEVISMMPPSDDFEFLHVTLHPVTEEEPSES